ncbi:MAG TPA: hypothetical protein VE825_09320 [Terriglobales bacterium]|jgi:molybdenum cofactor biosynthesis enzyme MoaA|nr:hypothetical protein [Terriglobales bacterium]
MQLTISNEECSLLASILTTYRGNLRAEIYRTESVDFKKQLKREEQLLDRLLDELQSQVPA